MMLTDTWLPTIKQVIRDAVVLPSNENIDAVMLAALLVNHVPERQQSVWMVLVTPKGEPVATQLLDLIVYHPSAWQLPSRLTPSYFASSRTFAHSALSRVNANSKLLLVPDMATVTDAVYWHRRGDIDVQLKAI